MTETQTEEKASAFSQFNRRARELIEARNELVGQVQKLLERGGLNPEELRAKLEQRIEDGLASWFASFQVAQTQDVDRLSQSLKALEERVAQLEGSDSGQ
ncbi:MAG: hypothetical protein AAFX94_00340 [Myxococcota bacterium]